MTKKQGATASASGLVAAVALTSFVDGGIIGRKGRVMQPALNRGKFSELEKAGLVRKADDGEAATATAAELRKQLDAQARDHSDEIARLADAHRDAEQKLQDDHKKAEAELREAYQGEVYGLQAEIKTLLSEPKELRAAAAALRKQIARHEAEIERLTLENSELRKPKPAKSRKSDAGDPGFDLGDGPDGDGENEADGDAADSEVNA